MKGIHGLIIAGVLGVLGAMLNFFYLESKTKGDTSIAFLGVKPGITIRKSDRFTEDMLVAVKIPERHAKAGNLTEFVWRYKDLKSVTGFYATRDYRGGELVFRQQIITPTKELVLDLPDERTLPILVDSRTFISSHVNPDQKVWFVVPAIQGSDNSPVIGGAGMDRFVGPFLIKAVGNRLGSEAAMSASKISQEKPNVISIVVKINSEQFKPALALHDLALQSGGQGISVSHQGPELPNM